MFFFFKKSKSKKRREREKNKAKKQKKGSISRQQMEAISDFVISKRRLVVYAESL